MATSIYQAGYNTIFDDGSTYKAFPSAKVRYTVFDSLFKFYCQDLPKTLYEKITSGAYTDFTNSTGVVFTSEDNFKEYLNINLAGVGALGGSDPLDLGLGLVNGRSSFAIIGSQDDIGTSFAHLWNGGGNMVYPVVAETLEVVSSDANDTIAGTGAQKILISTLDIDKAQQTPVEVEMNGTTPVVISGTHFRTNSFVVTQVGTVGTSGVAIGAITLRVSGGGATRGKIIAGGTSDTKSHYTVPEGKTAVWVQAAPFSPKGEDVQFRSRFQLGGVGVFFIGATAPNYQNSIVYKFHTVLVLPEKTDFLLEAKSTNASTFGIEAMEFTMID